MSLSHRIAEMNQGRRAQVGEPVAHRRSSPGRVVADLSGRSNLLDASVRGHAGQALDLDVAGLGIVVCRGTRGMLTGATGTFAIRPERIAVARDLRTADCVNRFPGRVIEIHVTRDDVLYVVEVASGRPIDVMQPNPATGRASTFFKRGDAVEIGWPEDAGQFLPV